MRKWHERRDDLLRGRKKREKEKKDSLIRGQEEAGPPTGKKKKKGERKEGKKFQGRSRPHGPGRGQARLYKKSQVCRERGIRKAKKSESLRILMKKKRRGGGGKSQSPFSAGEPLRRLSPSTKKGKGRKREKVRLDRRWGHWKEKIR